MSNTMNDERALESIAGLRDMYAENDLVREALDHIAARLAQTAAAVPEKMLVPSIIEAARCLGSAQATKDTNAVTYWTAQVDHYAQALAQRVVPSAEHWRKAIEEWEGRMFLSPQKLKRICDGVEQRARELASAPESPK